MREPVFDIHNGSLARYFMATTDDEEQLAALGKRLLELKAKLDAKLTETQELRNEIIELNKTIERLIEHGSIHRITCLPKESAGF